ncbi:MAG: DinB family protein [Anaerolineales bacterium]|nr:DinB family protein [Anaerolineales bacterium]
MTAAETGARNRLGREMEDTRLAFHRLLDSIPDQSFSLPSGNPAWTIGQVLYHMSLAPRFMVLDVQMIGGQRWIYRLVPKLIPRRLFDWLNARLTRWGAGNPSRQFLAAEYDRAHTAVTTVLDSLSEMDLAKRLPYPDWDPLLTGEVSMEYLFGYVKRHFDSHAAQIRRALPRAAAHR